MYIYAVHLKNFRRFSRLTLYPNPRLNIILGPNNSGKSSVLRALDLALNPSYHPYVEDLVGRFDFLNADITKGFEIWVYFRVEDSDSGILHDKVSRWLLKDSGELSLSTDQESSLPFQPAIKRPMEEEASQAGGGGIIELLPVRFSANWKEDIGGFDLSWNIIDEVDDETPFTQADRRAIGFTLIPTHRDPGQVLGFTRRSLLGTCINNSEVRGSLRGLIEKIDTFKMPLEQNDSMKIVLKAVKESARELQLFDGDGEFDTTITFLKAEVGRLRGALELAFSTVSKDEIVEDEVRPPKRNILPLSCYGDGMQNSLLLSRISSKNAEKQQCIEAIEEPEQSLEPWRIKSLMMKIYSNNTYQVFLTTHSPAAVGEIRGADNLLVLTRTDMNPAKVEKGETTVIHGERLPASTKKEFERVRDMYSRCLFGRLVLIVEGPSEMGYLPVALRCAAEKRSGPDLFSLGLELFENFESRENMDVRARNLKVFGKQAAVLLDYDKNEKGGKTTTQDRLRKSAEAGASVFVWSDDSILDSVGGCDLEVVLAEGASLPKLIEAIKEVYKDPGHEIQEKRWKSEYVGILKGIDMDLLGLIPPDFPDPASYNFVDIQERISRLTLFVLMHTPHSFKTTRDMRRMAELLGDDVPGPVLCLYDKLRNLLEPGAKKIKTGYWDLHKGVFVDANPAQKCRS